VSCRASEDVVIRAGEEVLVNVACSAVVTNEECATCFVSLVEGMEVCQGGDPDVKDDRREAYSCTGNGTKDLCLLLKNVSGVGMQFSKGADLANCQIVGGVINGTSDFQDQALHAVHVAADRAFAGSCAANVLTDRPVPKVHKFSLLRVLRMFNTPMVVFFSGINAIAVAAIKGQEQFGFSFFIALALDNSQGSD